MQVFQNQYHQLLLLVSLSFILFSCNNNYVEDIKRGAGYNYQPGYPELRMEVSGVITPNGTPLIQIAGSIPHNSLVFKRSEEGLDASANIFFEIKNKTTGTSETVNYPTRISKHSESSVFDDELFLFERDFEVKPGNYEITVTVVDQSSQKATTRTSETFLPNTNNEISNITNIQILAKYEESNKNFFPVTTYDVRSSSDSLKFVFQVTNNKPNEPITFQARLIKFEADTTVALPMSFTNPSASSIEYKGIAYDKFEVIQSSQRQLNQPGIVTIEFAFKNLDRGNYRFEVAPDLQEKGPLYKARDFGIKSPNYPSVKNPRELALPLVYLMNDKDHQKLMSIKSDDSLKIAIDRFWLENIQNSAMAKNVISLYYERVEEANKFFSNFKEGWKTDRGMVYILFGPPLDTYQRLRGVRWSYKYNQTDPEYTYYFRSTKTKTEHYPFDHYVLQRENRYFRIEYRIRQLWLSGNIITRNI